jgi:hypothetical protein
MDDVPAGPASPEPRRPSLSVVVPVRNGDAETGTQLELTARRGPLDSGGRQTGLRACTARNPCPKPGPTAGRTDLSRATHHCPTFGRADFVS